MRPGCGIAIGLLLVATIFLFMFANPVGWIFAALFGIAALVIVVVKGVNWQASGVKPPVEHPHGPEDRERGPNDDPML